MSILWFLAGFFIGGSIGTVIMAAACVAGRSKQEQSYPNWVCRYEKVKPLERYGHQ